MKRYLACVLLYSLVAISVADIAHTILSSMFQIALGPLMATATLLVIAFYCMDPEGASRDAFRQALDDQCAAYAAFEEGPVNLAVVDLSPNSFNIFIKTPFVSSEDPGGSVTLTVACNETDTVKTLLDKIAVLSNGNLDIWYGRKARKCPLRLATSKTTAVGLPS